MKINEFQNKIAKSVMAENVAAMTKKIVPPAQGTANFQRLIDSIASDLSAAALAAERAGLTLQYICEVALALANGTEDSNVN